MLPGFSARAWCLALAQRCWLQPWGWEAEHSYLVSPVLAAAVTSCPCPVKSAPRTLKLLPLGWVLCLDGCGLEGSPAGSWNHTQPRAAHLEVLG